MDNYTFKTTANVGRIIRKNFIRMLERIRFHFDDISLEWTENKGWFTSEFYITVKGEKTGVLRVIKIFTDIQEDLF